MEAKNFADFADSLHLEQISQQEATMRTMIGRWYYSIYHQLKNWLMTQFPEDWDLTTGKSHEKLSNCCYSLQRKYFDMQLSKLGRDFETMKKQRVKADYHLGEVCRDVDVEQAKLLYNSIFEQLKSLKEKYN